MRYYQSFRTAIPLFGAGHQRVTHPFATKTILLLSPFDLHVLSTPPAFILSQDRTLRIIYFHHFWCKLRNITRNDRASFVSSYYSSVVKVLCASKGQILLEVPFFCQGVPNKLPMTILFDHRPILRNAWRRTQAFLVVNDLPFTAKSSTHLGLKFYSRLLVLSRVSQKFFCVSFDLLFCEEQETLPYYIVKDLLFRAKPSTHLGSESYSRSFPLSRAIFR